MTDHQAWCKEIEKMPFIEISDTWTIDDGPKKTVLEVTEVVTKINFLTPCCDAPIKPVSEEDIKEQEKRMNPIDFGSVKVVRLNVTCTKCGKVMDKLVRYKTPD